jgi:hypothetical protein
MKSLGKGERVRRGEEGGEEVGKRTTTSGTTDTPGADSEWHSLTKGGHLVVECESVRLKGEGGQRTASTTGVTQVEERFCGRGGPTAIRSVAIR